MINAGFGIVGFDLQEGQPVLLLDELFDNVGLDVVGVAGLPGEVHHPVHIPLPSPLPGPIQLDFHILQDLSLLKRHEDHAVAQVDGFLDVVRYHENRRSVLEPYGLQLLLKHLAHLVVDGGKGGSSIKSTRGLQARALMTAVLCFMPPEI